MIDTPTTNKTLGYCTNVHSGRDLDQTLANLDRYAVEVKSLASPNHPLPLGLWLSNNSAKQLLAENNLPRLQDFLASRNLSVFTINGFPFGDFHQPVVKHNVYLPSWHDTARIDYTKNLAKILATLIPENAEGSISTLPIAWGKSLHDDQPAINNLLAIIEHLAELEQQTSRLIHLDIEPEPGCLIDTADDIIRIFGRLASHCQNENLLRRHLRVCHDICHSSVMFQNQQHTLDQYRMAGIAIGKVQISSAIQASFDNLTPDEISSVIEALKKYCEPRYLHQTVIKRTNSTFFYEDLPLALQSAQPTGLWRTHFHVPIFLDSLAPLQTTQQDILDCLAHLQNFPDVNHFEVETYAYNVLPDTLRPDNLAAGIARELNWLENASENNWNPPSP